jgi:hypothetical protein
MEQPDPHAVGLGECRCGDAERSAAPRAGDHRFLVVAGRDVKPHVVRRCRRIGHDDDPGGGPGIPFLHGSRNASESSEKVRTTKDGQFLESADVLPRNDHQTVDLRLTDHHDVVVEMLSDIGIHTPHPVVGHRLRDRAGTTLPRQGVLAGNPRPPMALIQDRAQSLSWNTACSGVIGAASDCDDTANFAIDAL